MSSDVMHGVTGEAESFNPDPESFDSLRAAHVGLEEWELELLREWQRDLAALMREPESAPRMRLNRDAIAAVAKARQKLSGEQFARLMRTLA